MCVYSVIAMTLAGKMYFEAVGKIGENAAVSPVSRELGEYRTSCILRDVWVCPSSQPQDNADKQIVSIPL